MTAFKEYVDKLIRDIINKFLRDELINNSHGLFDDSKVDFGCNLGVAKGDKYDNV